MPRNISFSMTTEAIRNKWKFVTRRLGWKFAKAGDRLNACVKCMGLKPGEKIEKICEIEIESVRFEPLNSITDEDCIYEGFPHLSPEQFVEMFCRDMKCPPDQIVTRIAFKYV